MKKNFVIIVGGGILTIPAYRFARKDLGLGIIALDQNPKAPGMLYSDIPINVSTKDVRKAIKAIKGVLNRDKSINVKGVFTVGADVEVTVAAIAESLSLPSVSVDVAKRCNDKLFMHQYLDSKNFTMKANYAIVDNLKELKDAVYLIGVPCVIKPIDNCASRGVSIITALNQVEEGYSKAVKYNISNAYNNRVIVEEYLVGTKHTIEMIVYKDNWYLLSIIDTHYLSKYSPCESGLNTTILDRETQKKLFRFSMAIARLIGIDFGAHKVDVNLSPDGEIKLIELTARLSGGFHCQYVSPLAYGTNDIRAALKLSIGLELDMDDITHKYERGAAVKSLFPPPGRIVAIHGVKEAREMPGVEKVFILKKIGDIIGPYENSADRGIFIIAKGKDGVDAMSKAEAASREISVVTQRLES